MIQVIKCPSCAAPLEFEGAMIEQCDFCGNQVIVSPNEVKNEASFGFDALLGKAQRLKEVLRLARSGKKIEAIKLYRETFGGNLSEAKDAVERLERGESLNFQDISFQSYEPLKIHGGAVVKTVKVVGGATAIFIVLGLIVALAGIGIAIYSLYKAAESKVVSTPTPFQTPASSAPNATANEKVSYATEVLRFGGEGTGAGYFKDNRSIAIDGDGRMYSGDYIGGRIQIFDRDGKFVSQLMVDEERALLDLAADRKGNIFVSQKGKILKFEAGSGKLSAETSAAGSVRYLTVSLDGKIVATDERNIFVFDENLKQLAVWKDAAQQAGLKFGISHLAVNGLGEIYALGKDGKDVCKFSRAGKFIDRFKTKSGRSEDIAVDGKNRIVISDVSEVYVYDANGNFIDSFKAAQAFGLVFNDAGELLIASRPFVVKYKLKD